ncbi:hypothetical protein DSECCO2_296660 [anaerobic digester metagenome]
MDKPLFQVFQVQRLTFLNQGIDDISLPSGFYLFANKLIKCSPLLVVPVQGLHRFSSGRQFINHGDIQIAVDRHGERTGDRGGRHHQNVWRMLVLRPKFRTLRHTKTMLFVDNHKSQVVKLHHIFNKGVGADKDVYVSRQQSGMDVRTFFFPGRARQQRHIHVHVRQQPAESLEVL